MSRRRPRRSPERFLAEAARAQRTAGAGLMYTVAPLSKQASAVAQALGSLGASGTEQHQIDLRTCTGGPQDFTLSYLPQPGSWNVSIGVVSLHDGVGYTIDGQTLSLLTAADAQAGEVVQIQYDYITGIPAVANAPFADLILSLGPMWWGRLGDVSNGGTLADSSGHARHGLWNPVTSHGLTPGLIANDSDQALLMTGAGGEGGSVTSASWMNLTQDMTWVIFFASTDTAARLLAREQVTGGGQDWSLQFGGGQLHFAAGGSVPLSSVRNDLDDGDRHMAMFRKSATGVSVLIDGVPDSSAAYATPLGTSAYDLLIGYGGGIASGHMFAGTLDEGIWFDKLLTDDEGAQIWDAAT